MDVVTIDIPANRVELLLAALKTAESIETSIGSFAVVRDLNKLHASLRKQIYTYEKVEE